MGQRQDAQGRSVRARGLRRRECRCLCEGCGRSFVATRWNQRYCGKPACVRQVQRWQQAKRQERCRATWEGAHRHRERERLRRRRARERARRSLLVLLALVVNALAWARPARPKKGSEVERARCQLLALLLLLVLPVASAEDCHQAEDDLGDDPPNERARPDGEQPEEEHLPELGSGSVCGASGGPEEGQNRAAPALEDPLRGHAPRRKTNGPFCDRPGCYGAPRVWTRWGECFCSAGCQSALRRVEDRERKWLERGMRAGVAWCERELAWRREERCRRREQLLAIRLHWMPGGSASP